MSGFSFAYGHAAPQVTAANRRGQTQTPQEHQAARAEAYQQGRNYSLGSGASRNASTVYAAQAANMTKAFGSMSLGPRGGKRRSIRRKQRKTRKTQRSLTRNK